MQCAVLIFRLFVIDCLIRQYRTLIMMGVDGICYTQFPSIKLASRGYNLLVNLSCADFSCLGSSGVCRSRHLPVALPNRTIALFGQDDLNVDDDERADSRPLATMSRRQSRIPVDTRQNDTLLEFENCEFVVLLFDLPTNTR